MAVEAGVWLRGVVAAQAASRVRERQVRAGGNRRIMGSMQGKARLCLGHSVLPMTLGGSNTAVAPQNQLGYC